MITSPCLSAYSDHPHIRGENLISHASQFLPFGPSPHTWGKLETVLFFHHDSRTIPTYVGKTMASPSLPPCTTDHPHIRGENIAAPTIMPAPTGPSPHTWGKLLPTSISPAPFRTIPTYVGKTFRALEAPDADSDHPHIRGENGQRHAGTSPTSGPSPHTWGKRDIIQSNTDGIRTIPTYVGKTCAPVRNAIRFPDHPHIRGENVEGAVMEESYVGPSPHTWGKPIQQPVLFQAYRTIPTYVGKTPIYQIVKRLKSVNSVFIFM